MKDAQTKVTTHDDPKDGFRRTALIIDTHPKAKGGSVDLVDTSGKRLAQINVCLCDDGTLIVDVIDVDEQYTCNRAIGFERGGGPMHDVRVHIVGSIEFSNDPDRVAHLKDEPEAKKTKTKASRKGRKS